MHQLLNDPIDVIVEFRGNFVRPTHIRWNGRQYITKHVHLVHGAREGHKQLYYFSVTDNTTYMKLQLDTSTLAWRIVEMYTE